MTRADLLAWLHDLAGAVAVLVAVAGIFSLAIAVAS